MSVSLTSFLNNTPDGVNLFYQPLIPDGVRYLDAVESKHSAKVLRKKNGDDILITDGKGFFYNAIIKKADIQQCHFEIAEKVAQTPYRHRIHIAISPTKNPDRIEWFVEKAIELGVDEITLIGCDHTERSNLKVERLEKLAISAMKQSLKATLPGITPTIKFSEIVRRSSASSKYIAYVDGDNPNHLKNIAIPHSDYLVLIGPEGDFSREELNLALENNFQKVSLGSGRLRTETAGLAACHILNLVNTT